MRGNNRGFGRSYEDSGNRGYESQFGQDQYSGSHRQSDNYGSGRYDSNSESVSRPYPDRDDQQRRSSEQHDRYSNNRNSDYSEDRYNNRSQSSGYEEYSNRGSQNQNRHEDDHHENRGSSDRNQGSRHREQNQNNNY